MSSSAPTNALPDISSIPKGRIGRFIAERKIGEGSIGAVYLFRDPLIGRKVAIKILHPQLPAHQRQLFEKQFIHEARAAGRLNHPNIVTVYDADKTDDLLFIAMEFLEGCELRDLLVNGHHFSYRQIADLVARIANALDYAHQHGVIHRDIKPANIFIVGRSTPKVLDFGIASASRLLADPEATLGQETISDNRLIGTPSYMSPEQTRGEKLDARTDIFSLGVVLYQLLCGQLPFKGEGLHELLESIAHDAPIPPQDICADVPLRLAYIAGKALAKKPADRYASAADMAKELNRYLSKERTNQIIAKLKLPAEDSGLLEDAEVPKQTPVAVSTKTPYRFAVVIGIFLTLALWAITWLALRPASRPVATPVAQIKESTAAESALPAAAAVSKSAGASVDVRAQDSAQKADVVAAKAVLKATVKTKPAATMKAAPAAVGTVLIAVAPWGEVYVDGKSKGVAPPLSRLTLPVGAHRIEIRNGEVHHAVNIEVSVDNEIKVSHRF